MLYNKSICDSRNSLKKGDFMSSKSGFISNLNKSTKVTMVSCLGFILLTAIILAFFILFPITPSEKVLASIGRENVQNNGSGNSPQNITPGVITTSNDENDVIVTTTRPVSTTTRTVNIRITTGSGFLWNGRIPTGIVQGGSFPTTVVDDPVVPTPDPGYTGTDFPQSTLPPVTAYPGVDVPTATTPNPDPNGGTVTPPAETPVTPEPPVETPTETPVTPPETPVTPPETPVEPPVDTPVTPPVNTPAPPADNGGGDITPVE